MDRILQGIAVLLALIWTVGTCFYPDNRRTHIWLAAIITLGVSLIFILLIAAIPQRTNRSSKSLQIREALLFVLMTSSFCMHFLANQPFSTPSRDYFYGLNAAWYYFIADKLLHYKLTKVVLPFVNSAVLLGILKINTPLNYFDILQALLFVIILSALTLRNEGAQVTPAKSVKSPRPSEQDQLVRGKTRDNLALMYKVFEKLPCGIIRFDENLRFIQSNQAARKLFDFPTDQEMSDEIIYEVLSKTNSLKIRKDRQDKELLCNWLGELANSTATPSKRQQPLNFQTQAIQQENINSSRSMLNREETILEKENRQKNEATDNAFISFAELFHHLKIKGGARAKELFEFGNPVTEDEVIILDGKFKLNDQTYEKTIEFEFFTIHEEVQACKQIIMAMKDMTVRDKVSVVENNSAFKENLFRSMSHELRTPLGHIMYSLDSSIKEAQISTLIKDNFLVPAYRSSKYLLSIIDDLQDFWKFQLNKLDIRFETFEVADAIEYCVEIFRSNAERKGIQLTVTIDRSIPKRIRSDKARMSQILLNLLANAIKFSESNGFVKLTVDSFKSNADSLKEEPLIGLKISVEDKGIGMSSEDQKRLIKSLEVWEMVDKTSVHSTGAGFGLFISNRLAILLSPDETGLKMVSTEGKGSTFTFFVLDQPSRKDQLSNVGGKKESFLLNKMKNNSYSRFVEAGSRNLSAVSSIIDCKIENSVLSNQLKASSEFLPPKQTSPLPSMKKGSVVMDAFLDQVMDDAQSIDSDRGTAIQKHMIQLNGTRTSPKSISTFERNTYTEKKKACCPMILVVDDDATNHFALEQMLGALSMMHDAAFNGREALNKYKSRIESPCKYKCSGYQLIFMDNNMPVLNGIDATKLIRDFENANKLEKSSIIGCTAYTDQPVEYYVSVGMNDCIFKPVNFARFSQIVAEHLNTA